MLLHHFYIFLAQYYEVALKTFLTILKRQKKVIYRRPKCHGHKYLIDQKIGI